MNTDTLIKDSPTKVKQTPYSSDNNRSLKFDRCTSKEIQRISECSYNFHHEEYLLPAEFKELINTLKKAEKILELQDDWDNEGSEKFSIETFSAVIRFIINYAGQIYNKYGYPMDIPQIYPGPKGSMDIDWETNSYGLIINIAKGGEQASYYGDNKARQMTEGVFNPREFNINLLPKAITF